MNIIRFALLSWMCLLGGFQTVMATPAYALIDGNYYAWTLPVELDLTAPSLLAPGIDVNSCQRQGGEAVLIADFSATLGSDSTTFYFSSIEYQPYDNTLILQTPGADLVCDQIIQGPAIFAQGFE